MINTPPSPNKTPRFPRNRESGCHFDRESDTLTPDPLTPMLDKSPSEGNIASSTDMNFRTDAMTSPLLTAQPLSQIRSAPLRWLWESYIPRGKLVLLDGDPGVGKSLLALDVAARISRGGFLPDGWASDRPHVTLFLSAEDSATDTLRPRAEATGGDLNQLLVVASADGALLRFPAGLPTLEALIRERRADLVVIDPVMAFLPPEVASNSDQCVRQVLTPLAKLAERTDCTMLL